MMDWNSSFQKREASCITVFFFFFLTLELLV